MFLAVHWCDRCRFGAGAADWVVRLGVLFLSEDFKSILVVRVKKMLILAPPGKGNIDLWWSAEHITLIFCRPEKENNDFKLILVIQGKRKLDC